jgi:hypothetical protein
VVVTVAPVEVNVPEVTKKDTRGVCYYMNKMYVKKKDAYLYIALPAGHTHLTAPLEPGVPWTTIW